MTPLTSHLKRYFTLVALAGLAAFVHCLVAQPYVSMPLVAGAAAVYVLAEATQLVLPSGAGFSSSVVPVIAFLWTFGPANALSALVLGALAASVVRRANAFVTLYNAASWCVALWAASWFQPLSRADPLPYMVASYVTFYACTSTLLIVGLVLYRRQPFPVVLGQYARETFLPFAGSFVAAALMTAAAIEWGVVGLALAASVMFVSQVTLYLYGQTLRGRIVRGLLARWKALAYAGDPRVRWQLHYATAIGEELGLTSVEQTILREATLLHDIAMDSVLPGVLTRADALGPEERAVMRRHPVVGADAIGRFAELADVARAVRHHHERWDGGGYPDGLAGEAIPLASRIIAVVDAFVALTHPLPYRGAALGAEEAMAVVMEESGRQFWPPAVEALRRILAREAAQNLLAATAEREQGVKAALDHLMTTIRRQRAFRQRFDGEASTATPEHWRALYELGRMINSSLSVTEVADVTLGVMARVFTGGGLVSVRSEEGWIVRSVRRLPAGLIGMPAGLDDPELAATSRDGATQLFDARRAGAWAAPFLAEGLRHVMVLPVHWNEETVAVIVFGRGRPFGEAEREVAEIIAAQAALAIGNATLFQERECRIAEIEALHRLTDAVIENMGAALAVFDDDGRLRRVNCQARRMWKALGHRLRMESGASIEELGRRLGPMAETAGRRLLRDGFREPLDLGEIVLAGPKDERVVAVTAAPLREDVHGGGGGIVVVLQDVTEHRRLEQEVRHAERLAAVGSMAAAAAHEIRNPLTAIKGFLQLLERDPGAAELAQLLPLVLSEVGRIERLTSDMLLLARPPADPHVACDLAEEVAAVLRLVAGQVEKTGVQVCLSGFGGPALVRGEAPRVRQVMLNLVRNALEEMPGGGRLSLCLEEDAGEYVLTVSDTGPGIPERFMDRLFEPFQTAKPHGTGLGLAVSASIVHSLGGRIQAANLPEGGACFRVTWPKALSGAGPREGVQGGIM
ncbi:MAG: HD domain-containing protein [Clostridia bacterium]|nr:HD domain-containing protein [Clostridia bacterium]